MSKMGEAVREIEDLYYDGYDMQSAIRISGLPRELVMQCWKTLEEDGGFFGENAGQWHAETGNNGEYDETNGGAIPGAM